MVLIGAFSLYLGRNLIFTEINNIIKETVEKTGRGIDIKHISYVPVKGIRLTDLTLYKDTSYKEETFYINNLYVKFPVLQLLMDRVFSPTITISKLEFKPGYVRGSFGFSIKIDKKLKTLDELLENVQGAWFNGLSFHTTLVNIDNIKGAVKVSPKLISTKNTTLSINGLPCTLSLNIADPVGNLSSDLKLSSSILNANLNIEKDAEIYKIQDFSGTLLNSSFQFMGEITSESNPTLSLYGKAVTNIEDSIHFVPEDFKADLASLKPQGIIESSIYFKTNLKNVSLYELGIKSEADHIKISQFIIDKAYMDLRAKDGIIKIPVLSGYPYGGTLLCSGEVDLTTEEMPYQLSCNLSNLNINLFLRNIGSRAKDIIGLASSRFYVKGHAKDSNSAEGKGSILISKANLGPMPLLTPLLGNIFGYIQYKVPSLRKVEITDGSCNFYIANRKIVTDDLSLWGKVMSIHGKGYMDFDTNLNFEVENKLIETTEQKEDWETTIAEIIGSFGKMISKAYLTGTLKKPKWKFEYLGGLEGNIKKGLQSIIKGIFE